MALPTMYEVKLFRIALKAELNDKTKPAPANRKTLVQAYNAILALELANSKLWDEICANEGDMY